MAKNKTKNKRIIFPNNQGGKIAALILGIIILIIVIWGSVIAFKKPSTKDALTDAANTKIETARVDVKKIGRASCRERV